MRGPAGASTNATDESSSPNLAERMRRAGLTVPQGQSLFTLLRRYPSVNAAKPAVLVELKRLGVNSLLERKALADEICKARASGEAPTRAIETPPWGDDG